MSAGIYRWAAMWHSGEPGLAPDEHLLFDGQSPLLFRSRHVCRLWIAKNYGYIAHRPDLRGAPHWWRMPRAVPVCVTITPRYGWRLAK